MIQKESFLKPSDKSGVLLVKTFHLYKGFSRKFAFVGNFIKVSARSVKPEASLKKKGKSIALINKTKYISKKLDGSVYFFYENSCILIKRKLVLRSKELLGPADYNLKRKKLYYKFPGVL